MATRVTFSAKSGATASGELALPEGSGKAPAIVLLQEWWGVNDHIRSLVDRFAKEGFVVLAPDLYDGKITKDAGEASKMMQELDGAHAMDIIMGAVAYVSGHERSTGKVGVTGFCMGGAYTLASVTMIPELAAAVSFYGIPPAARTDYTKAKAPILKHVARRDQWVTPASAEAIQKQVQAAGGSMDLFVYEADHAFVNDTRPEVYEPTEAQLALSRTYAFFRQHLTAGAAA